MILPEYVRQQTIDLFVDESTPLPGMYGHLRDERCIEIPWTLSRLPETSSKILDAGSTFNDPKIIERCSRQGHRLVIVTLSSQLENPQSQGTSYLYEDLRQLPFKDEVFDVTCSISTLEHVGMDNTIYGGPQEHLVKDYLTAVRELKRITKKTGKFLITVPYGSYEDAGWFQLFDETLLNRLISIFSTSNYMTKSSVYQRIDRSWYRSTTKKASKCRYDHDGRSAEAVVCLEIVPTEGNVS